jgi:hypothetical protein
MDAASNVIDSSGDTHEVVGDTQEVVDFLKINAEKARRTGNICVAITLVIGAVIITTFLYYAQVLTMQRYESQKDILETNFRLRREIQESTLKILEAGKTNTDPSAREAAERAIQNMLKSLDSDQAPDRFKLNYEDVFYNISSSIIRIGAVLVGIFIIQIMVTFARYYFRMAEHLSMASALIKLSRGKISKFKVMASLLLPTKLDFGAPPKAPTESAFNSAFGTIKELSKKILKSGEFSFLFSRS